MLLRCRLLAFMANRCDGFLAAFCVLVVVVARFQLLFQAVKVDFKQFRFLGEEYFPDVCAHGLAHSLRGLCNVFSVSLTMGNFSAPKSSTTPMLLKGLSFRSVFGVMSPFACA